MATTRKKTTSEPTEETAEQPTAPAGQEAAPVKAKRTRRKAATPVAEPEAPVEAQPVTVGEGQVEEAAPVKAKRTRRKAATPVAEPEAPVEAQPVTAGQGQVEEAAPVKPKRTRRKAATPVAEPEAPVEAQAQTAAAEEGNEETQDGPTLALPAATLLFQAPDLSVTRRRVPRPAPAAEPAATEADSQTETAGSTRTRRRRRAVSDEEPTTAPQDAAKEENEEAAAAGGEDDGDEAATSRTRRRRGSRGRRGRNRGEGEEEVLEETSEPTPEEEPSEAAEEAEGSSRRRRRRRSREEGSRDEVTALKGSTRLEAKRQRRREGRAAGRRRQLVTESEFLARRESVERHMIVRERDGLDQIAVLEDGLLVEHYVARRTQETWVGSVVLGRVQNVLPSMEAAFIDIGQGRNAVLYAGEVNWDLVDQSGKPRKIEEAMKSGDQVLVQVTKDPIGHKGARLTSQISLAGRFLVLVPGGTMTGISRKLPVGERNRLKKLLKEIVPAGAGVIVRTAAEGASDEQLRQDVERLKTQWAEIEAKRAKAKSAPVVLRGEPELALRVVRDIFNEDFSRLTIAGEQAWQTISAYVEEMSPELADRLVHYTEDTDVFAAHRVDEQLAKGMDRKVWLPSGGSLVIDRTEAMTVVDVNTGRYTGTGGTLEETVTRNNLEAAEEIVRQLRLRDIGGIIVIDFVDMVLSQNRDLVLRRLVECLGRDRTRHQVTEITALGLVQMTRKRVGQGLVEAFSTQCSCCHGRGFIVHDAPVEQSGEPNERAARRRGSDEPRRAKAKAAAKDAAPTDVSPRTRRARQEEIHVVPADRTDAREKLAMIARAAAVAHEEEEAQANAAAVDSGRPEPAETAQAPAPVKRPGRPRTRRVARVDVAAPAPGGAPEPVAPEAAAAPQAGETVASGEPSVGSELSVVPPVIGELTAPKRARRARRAATVGPSDPLALSAPAPTPLLGA
ncbi:Rne/Rng family ribonuclease, partial [Buchananella hordeovulneris]|uniref:Rne/Rng family ribonuclease n=1 Tax=Buchananella hordeovulneris TaxID=52770 RepID=UPI000F5D91AB